MIDKDVSIGNQLRLKRIRRGYSVDELGRKIGVNGSTISRWENGKLDKMGRRYISLISRELGISPLTILGMDEKKQERKKDIATKDEWNLLKRYRTLDNHGKRMVNVVLDFEFDRVQTKTIDNIHRTYLFVEISIDADDGVATGVEQEKRSW